MILTRDQILEASDRRTEVVKTPEWGKEASIYVRTLTGTERDDLEAANGAEIEKAKAENRKPRGMRGRYAAAFISDADGKPLFAPSDMEALAGKSGAVMTRIIVAGMRLNAMREKDLEALEKN